jgi:hypothetical protein
MMRSFSACLRNPFLRGNARVGEYFEVRQCQRKQRYVAVSIMTGQAGYLLEEGFVGSFHVQG